MLVTGEQADTFVRLPAFYQVNVRVERRILFNSFTLEIYAEVVNATANRMVYRLTRDPSTGAMEEYSLRVFLPSIGVRGEI